MRKSIYSKQQKVLLQMLVQVREAARVSQVDLAAHLGVTQSEVSKFERGQRGLDVLQLRAWLAALGVPITLFIDTLDEKLGGLDALSGLSRRAVQAPRRPPAQSKRRDSTGS